MVFCVAALVGWQHYQKFPYGVLLDTPQNWCTAQRVSSFAAAYFLVSFIAGLLVVIIASLSALAWILEWPMQHKDTAKCLMLSMLRTLVLICGVTALTPIFEATLTIKVEPGCKGNVPNNAGQ